MDSSFIPGADSDEGDTYQDPKEKIAFMVKNLEGLEMQASEGAEPAVVPLEGKSFHEQLLALKVLFSFTLKKMYDQSFCLTRSFFSGKRSTKEN